MEMLLALGAGALLLALPLLLKGLKQLRNKSVKALEGKLPALAEGIALKVLDKVFEEGKDAIEKVIAETAKRAQDGKLDAEDRKAILALLKEETIGEVKRQLEKLKK
jgi:hypothetical protein